ncbi:hypothetical protein DITRI_Ditri09bG0146700 [Diplodiscus trichospermus]
MPPNKVKLALITENSARKSAYQKRKKSLMKMASELSTLCGVEACTVIYSPYESQPAVWPSPEAAQQVLSKFKDLSDKDDSKTKMLDQESYLKERILKAHIQLTKQCIENREAELTHAMFENLSGKALYNLNIWDLNHLELLIEKNLMDINKRVATLHNGASSSQQPAAAAKMVTYEATTKSGQDMPARRSGPQNVDTI